jgi:membrane-bound lytic murein transglycosylase MltF
MRWAWKVRIYLKKQKEMHEMMKMVNEGRTDYSLCRALQSQSWLKHQPALEEQIGFIREE